MFACWRKVDASDPETFITAVAAVLSGYPEHVVHLVTDPRTGLPGKQQFPPSAFEVRQECERHMEHPRWLEARKRRLAENQTPRLEAPREYRPTLEELKATLGDDWGITSPRMHSPIDTAVRGMSPEDRVKHYEGEAEKQAQAFRANPPKLSDAAKNSLIMRGLMRMGHGETKSDALQSEGHIRPHEEAA